MMSEKEYQEKSLKHWKVATEFPLDRAKVYPEHASAFDFNAHHGETILDYGCGIGIDAIDYLKRGNSVTLVDIIPMNVDMATRRFQEKGYTVKGILLKSSWDIPLPSDSFDLIHSDGVLMCIPQVDRVMLEFYRLCKSGGMIKIMLYTEQLRKDLDYKVREHMGKNGISETEAFAWACDGPGAPYMIPYDVPAGINLLERNGFSYLGHTTYQKNKFRVFIGKKRPNE
jgi:SAM-dependent methyltransferase